MVEDRHLIKSFFDGAHRVSRSLESQTKNNPGKNKTSQVPTTSRSSSVKFLCLKNFWWCVAFTVKFFVNGYLPTAEEIGLAAKLNDTEFVYIPKNHGFFSFQNIFFNLTSWYL